MLTNLLAVAAASWGLMMAAAPLLQLRRMVRLRSSEDLSLGYYLILLPGFALWAGYGWSSHDVALLIPNCLALLIHVTLVTVAVRLRRDGGQEVTAGAES